jgi:hypothetical protein
MAFIINGKTLPQGVSFTDSNGNSYPANWLNLSTAEEKAAIGITEVADEDMSFDNRFYWSKNLPKAMEDKLETNEDNSPMLDEDGNQVVTKGLKSTFIAQNKATAGSILAQTDWAVTRKSDIGTDIPASIVAARLAVRQKSDQIEAAITACTTVAELAALDFSYPKQ